jgi:solute carrier family 25 (mitochondrial phosphate transporter), member 3
MAAQPPPSSTGSVKLDAIKDTLVAKDPQKLSGVALYSRFAFAGAVCCSVTHGALTPVDVYVSTCSPIRRDSRRSSKLFLG